LHSFPFGYVRQLDAVATALVADLPGHTPLPPGTAQIGYIPSMATG
jgi:hypothetical protein